MTSADIKLQLRLFYPDLKWRYEYLFTPERMYPLQISHEHDKKPARFRRSAKWKFDIALPEWRLAIEVEGGIYQGKGHRAFWRFVSDCEKYNTACLHGWKVFRVPLVPPYNKPAIALAMMEIERRLTGKYNEDKIFKKLHSPLDVYR